MANELLMPKLGLTMEEGTLIEWYIGEGDSFKTGDLIFAVETEKITNDVEANEDGEILKILVNEGETVEVKTPVARLVGYQKEESSVEDEAVEKDEKESPVEAERTEKVEKKKSSSKRIMAAPKARKLAADNNLDLAEVAESIGKNRISFSDLEEYLEKMKEKKESVSTAKKGSSAMRRIIGERLTESWQEPHIYLKKEINVEELLKIKATFKDKDLKIFINDIISFITAKAIKEYKKINTIKNEAGDYEIAEDINLGLAVAVESGLLVPVVEKAAALTLKEFAAKSKDLITRTKNNKLNPDEMQGGTFTVTNLGMFGIDEFTAILNPPQTAILAVGAVKEKLYLNKADQVKETKVINFNLAVNHRAIDGAVGAEFMQILADKIENPYLCL